MANKFKVGDKALVTGYDSPTAYFRDFHGKVVTVARVVYDKVDKVEYLEIEEFGLVEPIHLATADSFKKVD